MWHYLPVLIDVETPVIGLAPEGGRQGVDENVCHRGPFAAGANDYQVAHGPGQGYVEQVQIVNSLQTCFQFVIFIEDGVCQLAAEPYG